MEAASLGVSVQLDLLFVRVPMGTQFPVAAGTRSRMGDRIRPIAGGDPGAALNRESEPDPRLRTSQGTAAKVSLASERVVLADAAQILELPASRVDALAHCILHV